MAMKSHSMVVWLYGGFEIQSTGLHVVRRITSFALLQETLPPPTSSRSTHLHLVFALCFALALKIQTASTDQSYWVLLTRARRNSTTQRERFGSWWVKQDARFLLHVPLWVPGVDRRLDRFFEERQHHLVDGRRWERLAASPRRLSEPPSLVEGFQIPCRSVSGNRCPTLPSSKPPSSSFLYLYLNFSFSFLGFLPAFFRSFLRHATEKWFLRLHVF